MKTRFKNLLTSGSILSAPGLISIFISLLAIPIHLKYAGPENYGNYIIFHFILMISINFNLGIGKSTTISINNFIKKKKEISYEAITYTKNIALVIFGILIIFYFLKKIDFFDFTKFYEHLLYLLIGSIITIFFVTFEGILQGNRKFKTISILNLFFFSFSISIPSLLLIYNKNLLLGNLILISLLIKFFSILAMFFIIKNDELYKYSKSKILYKNLKANSKWITLNNILIQFYDLFDKYLIKYFLGPVAVATYSIPQQLTGKLSIISKSFSAFLLPELSKKKINNVDFNFSLQIFTKYIPIFIFILFPFYPIILEFWLGNSYNETIYNLTKIFSLSVIFSCASHILVTKFEATKTLYKNLKIEFYLMPLFLFLLFFLTSKNFSLFNIAILILLKETILFFIRLNFLKFEVVNFKKYYFFSLYFLLILFLSFLKESFYYLSLIPLIIILFKK